MSQVKLFRLSSLLFISFVWAVHARAAVPWNQFLPQPLLKSDKDMMYQKARVELTDKNPGTILSWTNPESKLSGTVTLNKVLKIHEYDCRDIVHVLEFPNKDIVQFKGTLCQIDAQKDQWELLPFTFENRATE